MPFLEYSTRSLTDNVWKSAKKACENRYRCLHRKCCFKGRNANVSVTQVNRPSNGRGTCTRSAPRSVGVQREIGPHDGLYLTLHLTNSNPLTKLEKKEKKKEKTR